MNEPYETMPEGQPHALADWITRLLAFLLLALIVLIASACPAQANNWCGDYSDGYLTGYCWTRTICEYVPPVVCPSPVDGQEDGYVVGLRDGLKAGRMEI